MYARFAVKMNVKIKTKIKINTDQPASFQNKNMLEWRAQGDQG